MSLDPSTNAATLAALLARSDYQQFQVLQDPKTTLLQAGHPFQHMFQFPIVNPIALTWQGVYRGVRYGYQASPPNANPLNADKPLIVPSAQLQQGIAALLTQATNFFDELDRQAATFGANPNPYAPSH